MVRELDHRGKNTFAVVESIVMQTLAHDPDTAKVITGRIRAVSSTNDIISHAANLQPDLHTLIRAKFKPFGEFRASLKGGDIKLPADAARNLSLVFHELVTNAIKHGALSRPEGRHRDFLEHRRCQSHDRLGRARRVLIPRRRSSVASAPGSWSDA